MRLYSWRMEAYTQWNDMGRIQWKGGDGTFYVKHGNLSERKHQMWGMETKGVECSMATRGMSGVLTEECVLQRKEPS